MRPEVFLYNRSEISDNIGMKNQPVAEIEESNHMAITNAIENFEMVVNEAFVSKAEALAPKLIETIVRPIRTVNIVPSSEDYTAREAKPKFTKSRPMGRDDSICLDFGDHQVGYVSFRLSPIGSPADAPVYLRLKFAEIPYEIAADPASYHGEISRAWIQEEFIHVDIVPTVVRLPRRYAFRYMQITVIDTSAKYMVVVSDVVCRAVSSADMSTVPPLNVADPDLIQLDKVSLKTMQDCMQSVFEDGPKRDRRLWLADLRLQALTNYVTFRNNDLVKRCLYLFAGLTQNEGRVGACLFHEPKPQVDDTALFDYSLFFVSCLHDYYEATGDMETLKELFPTADRQIELSLWELDERDIVTDKDTWWCFLDWGEGLNKQAGAQAILIYTLKQAKTIARWLGDTAKTETYETVISKLTKAALTHLWDEEQGFFVSGANRQVSWASQVWFALANVFDHVKNAQLLKRLIEVNPGVPMVTPYMYHYFIDALIQNGIPELALSRMKAYWGEMIRDGADTFFELYDPNDRYASPYCSRLVNSFCHAWSGTPSYFIRTYFNQ